VLYPAEALDAAEVMYAIHFSFTRCR
jgi:hypothetical protein